MKGHTVPSFHTVHLMRRSIPCRVFAAVYVCALSALFYRHATALLFRSTTLSSASLHLPLLIADLVLAFMWATVQPFRMCPVQRNQNPEKLAEAVSEGDFPALDVFVCTADPYKEPPVSVVNTALSVMAYEYPPEKLSVYVSDDGGSELTLFAFMEASKFGRHWLPFCRERNIMDRSPEAYFTSNPTWSSETQKMKMMYESMKDKIEKVVDRGTVGDDYITYERECQAFDEWTSKFTRHHHPTVIKVLLDTSKDKDTMHHPMPNLIYVSRQKSPTSPHHFKAGALNTLLRVSATMTNAPIVLTVDCDMHSNDPHTPLRALCYFLDPMLRPGLGYIQFPQHFRGINEDDTYASEYKRLFQINPLGLDGLRGPNNVGTGCFFSRRAFFGSPSTYVSPDIPELGPTHVPDRPIQVHRVLPLAYKVAACDYEDRTDWGSKVGFRYGSLIEDFYTGYLLQCEGWQSVFCNPDRPAFLGDVPISLNDVLSQCKRWNIGQLEVLFSRHCPLTYGIRSMGFLMGLGYAHYACWTAWSLPVAVYAFLPQLALLCGTPVAFPKASDPWSFLYAFLFLGSYAEDFIDFVLAGGTSRRWWSGQRMWLFRGLSCFPLGVVEFLMMALGLPSRGFVLTSKVVDESLGKRNDRGLFEFGVAAPMFVPLVAAAVVNLFTLVWGLVGVVRSGAGWTDAFAGQMLVAGGMAMNCWPIYEAMFFRSDKGKIPAQTMVVSTFVAWALYMVAFSIGSLIK